MKSLLAAAIFALAAGVRAQDAPLDVRGRVVEADGGRPVGGADVYAPGGLTKSDADGWFGLPAKREPEDQTLIVRAPGFALFHAPLPERGGRRTDIIVRFRKARVAAVRVVGEDGKPLAGRKVRGRLPFAAAYSVVERLDFEATTDEAGLAVIEGVPADDVLVAHVRSPGHLEAQTGPLVPLLPATASVSDVPVVVLTAGRALEVAVEDAAGRPVAGASINLLPLFEPRLQGGGYTAPDQKKGPIRAGVTNAAGSCAFDLLPAGPITCEVRAQGMLTQLRVGVPAAAGAPTAVVRFRVRPDPDPPAADIPWRLTVPRASIEARETGRPVFVAMTMDGERANDWLAGHHYHDREIVRAARECIPLLSSCFGQDFPGSDPNHTCVKDVCTRYGTIPCSAHQHVDLVVRPKLMERRPHFEVPRHWVTTPDGDEILHRVFYLSERDLLRLIMQALRIQAPDAAARLARERLAGMLDDLAHADAAVRAPAIAAFAALANSGDEHAAALIQTLPALGLPAATRAAIVQALHPAAFTAAEETVRASFADPDAAVRDALLTALRVERAADGIRVPGHAAAGRWWVIEEILATPEGARLRGLDEALAQLDPEGRNRVLLALGRRAASDPAALDSLVRATRGAGAVAALRALERAAAAGRPAALEAIEEATRSGNRLARAEAQRLLQALGR